MTPSHPADPDAFLARLWRGDQPESWSSETLRSCFGQQAFVVSPDDLPDRERLLALVAATRAQGPEIAGRLNDFAQKRQLIGRSWSVPLGCAVSATESGRLMERLRGALRLAAFVACTRQPRPGDRTGEHLTSALRAFSPDAAEALSASPGASLDLLPADAGLIEARDLLSRLLREPLVTATRSASVRVLGYDGRVGFTGILNVDWVPLPDGAETGWIRHPQSLLLVIDPELERTFERTLSQAITNHWLPSGAGALRWNLTADADVRDDGGPTPLLCAAGDSLGGALGVALRSLADDADPVRELHTAITAAVTDRGELSAVGALGPKLFAALERSVFPAIEVVLLASAQTDLHPAAEGRAVRRAEDIEDAYRQFRAVELPVRQLRERLIARFSTMDLLGEVTHDGMSRHYFGVSVVNQASDDAEEGERADENPALSRALTIAEALRSPRTDQPLRLAVLGEPGGGKTTLLRHLAWIAARGADDAHELRWRGQVPLPAFLRLRTWERAGGTIPERLADDDAGGRETQRLWEDRLVHGEALLLIDGLDEVESGFLPRVRESLAVYAACPIVLTCRSAHRERLTALNWSGRETTIVSLCALDAQARRRFLESFPGRNVAVDTLLGDIERQPHLSALAGNPMLLSLIAFVASADQRVFDTRSAFYEAAVERLLEIAHRRPRVPIESAAYRQGVTMRMKRRAIEEVALSWSAAQPEQTTLSESDLQRILSRIAGSLSLPTDGVALLLRDLCANLPLLQTADAGEYVFLHATFLEYLAACALAEHIHETGWESVRDELDRRAWSPSWREIFPFLAGRLAMTNQTTAVDALLRLLADPARDDRARHRLTLAARCLPEARSPQHRL